MESFNIKTQIYFGDGSLERLSQLNCKRVFIVTDPFMVKSGAIDKITQAVAREMVKEGSGVIINMSSESGLEGSEGQSVYAATKNAVNSFTRSWSKELGKQGVRVVGIAPGILEATGLRTIEYETALAYTRGITVEQLREGYSKTTITSLGRSGELTEVADLVCYIASGRASYIHGVTYNIAGGKTRG